MELNKHQLAELKNVLNVLRAFHEVANPSYDNPAASAIWSAVNEALGDNGVNYAQILSGKATIESILERANEA